MSTLRDALQRRRQELNPLTTTVAPASQQFASPTPTSANLPFAYNPTIYTPISAVRTYNPQQWSANSLSPENAAQYAVPPQVDGGDAVVPAPPPYSPPRSRAQTVSPDDASPAHHASPAAEYRPSPSISSTAVFPPPPGTRVRAGSRDRPQNLFNLSAFTRKPTAPDPNRMSPDMHRAEQSTTHRARPPPISVDLTRNRVELPRETPLADDSAFSVRPPASRRAASTGAINTPSTSRSRESSTTGWEPGMPLPPPPPGPPPQTSSRSQSMSRASDPVTSPPTRRPQTISASTLGPVPPTPADWVDEDVALRGRSPNRGLTIDTSTTFPAPPPTESTSGSSSSGLSRARAVRGEPKSIRERRSESRTGKSTTVEQSSNNPWAEAITPSDIVVPMTILGRRPTAARNTPKSAKSLQSADTPNSARTIGHNTPTLDRLANESRGSTPRPPTSSQRLEAPTPPFSPEQISSSYNDSPMIHPKSLPTPPPTTAQSRQSSETSPRPVSHLFHLPNEDSVSTHPLVPSRPTSQQSSSSFSHPSFTQEAINRHTIFAQKEAAAPTDEERVRLFAEFIVAESRLRRDRYASAIDAMGSELLELTRDLFRPLSGSQKNHSRQSSRSDLKQDRGSSLPSFQTDHSESRPSSGSGAPSPNQSRPDSVYYNNNYKPSLSPIASLSMMSEAPDESSSRGRPSSRWWEVGYEGPSSPSMKLERSKRESKYMGVPREVRESLQWEDGTSTPNNIAAVAGPSTQTFYGENEYPPEKVGWHEHNPTSSPPNHSHSYSPAQPQTPKPAKNLLDVSRLVTLPPPYPRHHPAVNNNHPDLTSIRTTVRALSNTKAIESTKAQFKATDDAARTEAARVNTQRSQNFEANIEREIVARNMSYADAAKLEAEFKLAEAEAEKAQLKTSFELFQSSVIAPLNDLLMERIHRATTLFDTLRSQLFVDAQEQSPNITQEEGDEQPELLEKLTLLKWIFEARETLHRELYDLLTDRNDRYAAMAIKPYQIANNTVKVANAELFFASDARKRALEAATASLARTTDFMDTVESNVIRGVEVQLSAFWDIAPGLSKVLEGVPADLQKAKNLAWGVVIPSQEYEENPQYQHWPLQYLWSLVAHGSASTYQFIESQTNLLCLLHEVKSAVATARARVEDAKFEKEAAGTRDGEETNGVFGGRREREEHVRLERENEERKLTEDLKEKVRCVEELWSSAIGEEFEAVKGRVRESLVRDGGWEGVAGIDSF